MVVLQKNKHLCFYYTRKINFSQPTSIHYAEYVFPITAICAGTAIQFNATTQFTEIIQHTNGILTDKQFLIIILTILRINNNGDSVSGATHQ